VVSAFRKLALEKPERCIGLLLAAARPTFVEAAKDVGGARVFSARAAGDHRKNGYGRALA
jgi:hypothetical protein